MEFAKEELAEAKRQIDSTLHKLRQTRKTLEAKGQPERYRSQITLAARRIQRGWHQPRLGYFIRLA